MCNPQPRNVCPKIMEAKSMPTAPGTSVSACSSFTRGRKQVDGDHDEVSVVVA